MSDEKNVFYHHGRSVCDTMRHENIFYYHGGKPEDKTITKVVIAPGVTKISDLAFHEFFYLQSVVFEEPHQLTEIGEWAFKDCHALKSIGLLKSLMKIGPRAFENCRALESIELPESLLEIGPWAFAGCRALREIFIPRKVTSIGWRAFEDSGIHEIVLSDGVKSITNGAFSRCRRLETVFVNADELTLLKRLDLQGSYESRGWEAMCKIVRKTPNLTHLSLYRVKLGLGPRPGPRELNDGDIPLVIQMVSACPRLESLDLSDNAFSDQVIRKLDSEGLLGRLRDVNFQCDVKFHCKLSAKEFLNILQKNPRLAIWTNHKWKYPKDDRIIRHYLDMNRLGCRGVPITNVSIWPRLIGRLGGIDNLKTCSANVLYHLLRDEKHDLGLHYYQQNHTK